MADINSIIRNNPNAFANSTDFCKTLYSYSMKGNKQKQINPCQKEMKFLPGGEGGIPLYYDNEREIVYIDQTDKHTLTIGQTGAKKSRLIAMPLVRILGAAKESMIISDPKAEIYYRTCGYLEAKGYDLKIINLREPKEGDAWNPLALPYAFYKKGNIDKAYELANDIAVNLTTIDKSQKDAFWDNSAGTLFLGLILLLFKFCYENNEPDQNVCISNIIELRNLLFSNNIPQRNPIWKYAKKDRFIEAMLIGTVTTAMDTRAGILSVFDQKMRAFSVQPALLDMLSYNDINYDSITEKPTAVFLLLPDEKTGYHNLVSLYIKQSYEYLIYKAQKCIGHGEKVGIRVNYVLDEFSSLPAISDFPAMITAARSRNIRFNLFLQSKKQLYLKYGEESETIMSNCENWIYLSSREIGFLNELSELCGEAGNSKKLLRVADLQRLDKEKGQTLILSGRNKPLIASLPDIDFYDNGTITPYSLKKNMHFKHENNNDFREKISKTLFEVNSPVKETFLNGGILKNEDIMQDELAEILKKIQNRIGEAKKEQGEIEKELPLLIEETSIKEGMLKNMSMESESEEVSPKIQGWNSEKIKEQKKPEKKDKSEKENSKR